jgi:hypothetical protein
MLLTLLERITQLEARLARVEARVPAADPPDAPRIRHAHEPLMKFRVLQDFSREERLQELRDNPGLLAAIRERRAAINAIYVSRGLTPDPDPYPELP